MEMHITEKLNSPGLFSGVLFLLVYWLPSWSFNICLNMTTRLFSPDPQPKKETPLH